jgi:hypothetical protein
MELCLSLQLRGFPAVQTPAKTPLSSQAQPIYGQNGKLLSALNKSPITLGRSFLHFNDPYCIWSDFIYACAGIPLYFAH